MGGGGSIVLKNFLRWLDGGSRLRGEGAEVLAGGWWRIVYPKDLWENLSRISFFGVF